MCRNYLLNISRLITVFSKSIYCPDSYLYPTDSLSALSHTVIIDFFPIGFVSVVTHACK